MNSKEIFKLLGVKEITTPRQKANGTKVFLMPQKEVWSSGVKNNIIFATYKSGYIRKTCPIQMYQLNPVRMVEHAYWNVALKKVVTYKKRVRVLIKNQEDRELFLAKYILKNLVGKETMIINEQTRKDMSETRRQLLSLKFGWEY